MKRILFWAAVLLTAFNSLGQNRFGGVVEFDKTVHDFGDILQSDGPVSCTYSLKNISNEPVVIYNVVSSCGCTDVKWTKEPLRPGAVGTVKATYKNDEGAYPFDKTLTVYLNAVKQPIVLHLRGVSHKKELPLEERYPVRFGNLGVKNPAVKVGNLNQGEVKSGETTVANLGRKPLKITFEEVSDGLALSLSPNPVPARGTAKLHYAVTASRERWGRNTYYAVPVMDGKRSVSVGKPVPPEKAAGGDAILAGEDPLLAEGGKVLGFTAYTKENFSVLTPAERANGSQPFFDESTFSFGKIKAGTPVEAVFPFKNKGKSAFVIYKADAESRRVSIAVPGAVNPGASGKLKATLDTSGMPSGEVLVILTLTTNSPLRPMVNLFINGWIE